MSTPPIQRHAACSCGQLALVATGEPVRISMCHCLACQRRTGTTYGVQARFLDEQVTITGRSTAYVRIGESGKRITFHFCTDCGATVHYGHESLVGATIVPVGAFADPGFPAPAVSVYEARRHPWVAEPADVEHLD